MVGALNILSFGSGSFQAIRQGEDDDGSTNQLCKQSPVPGTIDAPLASLVHDVALFDIRALCHDDRLEALLTEPQSHFSVGATDDGSPEEYTYGKTSNTLCFVRETTPTQPVEAE